MGLLFHRVLVVVEIINAAKIPKGSVTVHRDSNSILHADLYWTPLLGLRRRALFENDKDLAFSRQEQNVKASMDRRGDHNPEISALFVLFTSAWLFCMPALPS
jgi:hypothetical protein